MPEPKRARCPRIQARRLAEDGRRTAREAEIPKARKPGSLGALGILDDCERRSRNDDGCRCGIHFAVREQRDGTFMRRVVRVLVNLLVSVRGNRQEAQHHDDKGEKRSRGCLPSHQAAGSCAHRTRRYEFSRHAVAIHESATDLRWRSLAMISAISTPGG